MVITFHFVKMLQVIYDTNFWCQWIARRKRFTISDGHDLHATIENEFLIKTDHEMNDHWLHYALMKDFNEKFVWNSCTVHQTSILRCFHQSMLSLRRRKFDLILNRYVSSQIIRSQSNSHIYDYANHDLISKHLT